MQDRFHLTFPRERIPEPVMSYVARQFNVEFSIRRASVDTEGGWMDLQMEGDDAEIERAIAYLESRDIRVDPIEGDIVEG